MLNKENNTMPYRLDGPHLHFAIKPDELDTANECLNDLSGQASIRVTENPNFREAGANQELSLDVLTLALADIHQLLRQLAKNEIITFFSCSFLKAEITKIQEANANGDARAIILR